MGIVKWRMKKTQAANKYFLRALELNSDSDLSEEETLVVRGWLQVVTGQLEEGLANISRSFSQYPNPPHRASNVRDWTKALLLANDSPPGLERALQLAEKYLDSLH
jgi:hypothetical protein